MYDYNDAPVKIDQFRLSLFTPRSSSASDIAIFEHILSSFYYFQKFQLLSLWLKRGFCFILC